MIYVCSDIHGRWDKYKALMDAISLKGSDTLYILGDVIDRGSDGVKILQDMKTRPDLIPILGNHEYMAVVSLKWLQREITEESLTALDDTALGAFTDWMNNGGEPTLRAFSGLLAEEREDIYEYLLEMSLFAEVEAGGRSFVLTHAGLGHFAPDKPLEDYTLEDFLFARPAPESVYWPDKTLVFGHTPTRLLWQASGQPPKDEMFHGAGFIDIDCGSGFGGRLGCLCLETMEETYV